MKDPVVAKEIEDRACDWERSAFSKADGHSNGSDRTLGNIGSGSGRGNPKLRASTLRSIKASLVDNLREPSGGSIGAPAQDSDGVSLPHSPGSSEDGRVQRGESGSHSANAHVPGNGSTAITVVVVAVLPGERPGFLWGQGGEVLSVMSDGAVVAAAAARGRDARAVNPGWRLARIGGREVGADLSAAAVRGLLADAAAASKVSHAPTVLEVTGRTRKKKKKLAGVAIHRWHSNVHTCHMSPHTHPCRLHFHSRSFKPRWTRAWMTAVAAGSSFGGSSSSALPPCAATRLGAG